MRLVYLLILVVVCSIIVGFIANSNNEESSNIYLRNNAIEFIENLNIFINSKSFFTSYFNYKKILNLNEW